MSEYKRLTKKNFNKVMDKIKEVFEQETNEGRKVWVEAVDEMLDRLLHEDFFGTEGQCDPRGDQR